jgi:hypothetical protein
MTFSTLALIVVIIFFVIMPSFRDRVMPVKKLALIPAVFTYFLYETITNHFALNNVSLAIIVLGLITGMLIGIYLRLRTQVKADHEEKLIWLPATLINLLTFSFIFSVQGIIGYITSVHPSYLLHAHVGEYALLFMLISASCITLGSSACLFYKYLTSTPTKLNLSVH